MDISTIVMNILGHVHLGKFIFKKQSRPPCYPTPSAVTLVSKIVPMGSRNTPTTSDIYRHVENLKTFDIHCTVRFYAMCRGGPLLLLIAFRIQRVKP
jgi:hypothetical protein